MDFFVFLLIALLTGTLGGLGTFLAELISSFSGAVT